MEQSWFSSYETRQWTLHKVPFASNDKKDFDSSLKVLGDTELLVCGEGSPLAESRWNRSRSLEGLLFYDVEQLLAMDLDTVYGVDEVGILTNEWKGHPVGSLAMSIFKGVNEEPRCLTICIAKM